jgi:hypothetical protein
MSIPRPKRVSFRNNRESSTLLDQQISTRPASWAEAVDGKSEADFRAYSVKETYACGDGLSHPKFGTGVVVEVEASKIAVLFEAGERRLAHGMS